MIFIRTKKRIRSNRGMFLLEAILATLILAVTISIIIESLVSGLRAAKVAGHYSKALLLADGKLAEILPDRSAVAGGEADFSQPYEQYKYQLKTDDVPGQDGLKEVQLDVGWMSGRNEQSISVTTWLFEPPKDETP